MGKQFLTRSQKHIQWIEHSLLNKWCWENWKATCTWIKLDCCLTTYTTINSKWIKDLNIRPWTINYTAESTGNKLMDLDLRQVFVNLTPKTRKIKAKINEWDNKLKSFCTAKETINKTKWQHNQMGEYTCKQYLQ